MISEAGIHAERAVLGAALIDPSTMPTLRSRLTAASFARRAHALVWQALDRLSTNGSQIDPVTTIEALRDTGSLDDAGGAGYVVELASNLATAANATAYADIVAREARRRSHAVVLGEAMERLAHDDPDVVAGEVRSALDAASADAAAGDLCMLDLIELGFQDVCGADRPDLLATGVPPLDRMLIGLEPGRLYVIAARTSVGKSALALSMSHSIASAGHAVGFLSLEMPARELFHRLCAQRYGLNLAALSRRYGDIGARLDQAYQRDPLSALQFYVDDRTVELPRIVARAQDWHHRYTIKALFIDYLQLVRVKSSANLVERIGEVTRALKQLAKRLEIPVVALSQFNREPDKEARRPRLSDLRDSGAIEQDSDVVIAISPLSDSDDEGRRIVEIGVLKNRSGPCGWISDAVVFDGRRQRFHTAERTK